MFLFAISTELVCPYTVGMDVRPLAERMRPETLDDVLGQENVTATGKIIREIIEKKRPTSLILWGPPGTGKTTLARIIAKQTGAEFIELSAVTAGKADVTRVCSDARRSYDCKGDR